MAAFVFFIILIGTAIVSTPTPTREQQIDYGDLIQEFAQGFEQASDFMGEIYGSLKGRMAYEKDISLINIPSEASFEDIEKKYRDSEKLTKSCFIALNNNKESFLRHKNPFYEGSKLVQITQKVVDRAFSLREWSDPEDKRELKAWTELCERCQKKYVEIEQIYLKALQDQRSSLERGEQLPSRDSKPEKSDFFGDKK